MGEYKVFEDAKRKEEKTKTAILLGMSNISYILIPPHQIDKEADDIKIKITSLTPIVELFPSLFT